MKQSRWQMEVLIMILLIDNYDSFSYNLYQLIGEMEQDIRVIRNDEMTVEEIEQLNPDSIILSPGPGKPEDAGICEEVVEKLAGKIPILGVCLGHQAICEVYHATVTYASHLMHGKQSVVTLDLDSRIFEGLKKEEKVARYHSLAIIPETVPDCLSVIAKTDDGEIMAVRHKEYKTVGLQFHPESIYTEHGKRMIENFVNDRI